MGNAKDKPSKGMAGLGRKVPAKLEKKMQSEVESVAVKAFKAVGLSGVCRIDFLIDKNDNKVYINEINSIPGSLSFYLWEPKGKKYRELLDEIIKIGIKNYQDNSAKVHSFESNILEGYKAGGTKGGKFGCKGSKF